MKIPVHKIPPTYNATPRRVSMLAKYITDHLKAEQARCQAQGKFFIIRQEYIQNVLEGFVDPRKYSSK